MQDCIGCPPPAVDKAIVDSIIQFCKDTHYFKKTFEEEVEAADIDAADNDAVTIDLSAFTDLRAEDFLTLKIDNATYYPYHLDMEPVDEIWDYVESNVKYFNYPDITHVKLYPVQTCTIFLQMTFLPIDTITTIDDRIYHDHRQAIQDHARFLLMSQKGKTWSNGDHAIFHSNEYQRHMGRAKIQGLMGKAFGSLQVKRSLF